MIRSSVLALIILALTTSLLYCTEDSKQGQEGTQTKADSINALFKMASNAEVSGKFEAAVGYYKQIADNYPNSDQRDKALFMAGYLSYESLHRKDDATKYFDELLTKYPDSDLADDAEFMLKAVNSGKDALTTFEESNK